MSLKVPTRDEMKKARKSVGLTQKELARRAGVSQSLIARIEAEKIDPRMSTLNKILTAITSLRGRKTALDIMHSPVISVEVTNTVRKAVELMEKRGISQMPVLEDGSVLGSIQEATLIKTILQSRDAKDVFNSDLRSVMEESFPIINSTTSIEDVLAFFIHEKPAVLVMDHGKIIGIITKINIITSIKPKK
ncbi:MAG: CBS domain-containing protein [Candidatus Bathyarchaeota archaeon]